MNISYNQSTSFQAIYKNSVNVSKYNRQSAGFQDKKVSFVEIDPDSQEDVYTVRDVVEDWNDKGTFVSNIGLTAMAIYNDFTDRETNKVYAITEQLDNFEKLDPNLILGMTNVSNADSDRVDVLYVQVNPKYVYNKKSNYKHIGTGMLDSLKFLYNDRALVLNSVKSAAKFYERNNFKRINVSPLQYEWKKEYETTGKN